MVSRRTYASYDDGCAAAHALDLIGQRWTMLVVRELLLGPKRFSEIQRDVIGIGPAALTQRLQDLESHEIVSRRRLPVPGRPEVYELTEWGYELESVNATLSMWAASSPELPRDAGMSPDSLVLAMRAHAGPVPGIVAEQRVAVHLVDSRRGNVDPVAYVARIAQHGTDIRRSMDPTSVDAEISATTNDWKACIIGGVDVEQLPDIHVSGNHAAARNLIAATSLGSDLAPQVP
ncbi:MAG: helix-turn-helix transcriptional regulator [Rhodococcus sp.]|nr:helix-turn-helix transcriptional regulator [Rhodococcus sp. (in: high G+C Gram-positive bacteria)]